MGRIWSPDEDSRSETLWTQWITLSLHQQCSQNAQERSCSAVQRGSLRIPSLNLFYILQQPVTIGPQRFTNLWHVYPQNTDPACSNRRPSGHPHLTDREEQKVFPQSCLRQEWRGGPNRSWFPFFFININIFNCPGIFCEHSRVQGLPFVCIKSPPASAYRCACWTAFCLSAKPWLLGLHHKRHHVFPLLRMKTWDQGEMRVQLNSWMIKCQILCRFGDYFNLNVVNVGN